MDEEAPKKLSIVTSGEDETDAAAVNRRRNVSQSALVSTGLISPNEDDGGPSLSKADLNNVHEELEKLNIATEVINKLEVSLDTARTEFGNIQASWSQRLDHLNKKLGSSVEKSRPYYEARMFARRAQEQAQQAAIKFERANTMHQVAKQQVALSQDSLARQSTSAIEPACLEVLNHHVQRVNEAEAERVQAECEHYKISQDVVHATRKVTQLEKEYGLQFFSRAIRKSRTYFEARIDFTRVLEDQKALINRIDKEIRQKKRDYTSSLRNLEAISERIHDQRRMEAGRSSPTSPPSSSSEDRLPADAISTAVPLTSELAEVEQRKEVFGHGEFEYRYERFVETVQASFTNNALTQHRITFGSTDSSEELGQRITADDIRESKGEQKTRTSADPSTSTSSRNSWTWPTKGVLLMANDLVHGRFATPTSSNEKIRQQQFTISPDDLDMAYRTTPEGVRSLVTPRLADQSPSTSTPPSDGDSMSLASSAASHLHDEFLGAAIADHSGIINEIEQVADRCKEMAVLPTDGEQVRSTATHAVEERSTTHQRSVSDVPSDPVIE